MVVDNAEEAVVVVCDETWALTYAPLTFEALLVVVVVEVVAS